MSKTKKSAADMAAKMKAQAQNQSSDFDFNLEKYGSGDNMVHHLELSALVEAPIEWNFYSKLPDEKMSELIESIMENGLLTPIIVWEIETPGKYMILAGHNRVQAYITINEFDEDIEGFDKIPAFIKRHDEITIEDAKQIIIDTNWVTRQLSSLEKSKSILHKYQYIGRKKYGSEERSARDIISEEFKISGRQVEKLHKINDLIDDLKHILDIGRISINAAARLANFEPERQQNLFDKYHSIWTNTKIMKINSSMTDDEIDVILSETNSISTLKIEVDKDLKKELKQKLLEWLQENNIDAVVK